MSVHDSNHQDRMSMVPYATAFLSYVDCTRVLVGWVEEVADCRIPWILERRCYDLVGLDKRSPAVAKEDKSCWKLVAVS